MADFQTYYGFMEEYTEFYETVINVETKKLKALLSNELDSIVSSLTEYQTCIKKAQLIEQQRIDLCKNMGFENMAFSEISKHFEGDEKQELILQKNKLESLIKNIQYMNRKSMEIASMQLQYVDNLAAEVSNNSHIYNAKGHADSVLKNASMLDKKA